MVALASHCQEGPSEPAWRRADSGQFTLDRASQEHPSPAYAGHPEMRCAGCLPGNKLVCVSSPDCHISSMAPQGHSRESQPSCYQAGRQPAAKTCLQEAVCWGLREQGRMGAGPRLMQLPVPGAGRFPGPRRGGPAVWIIRVRSPGSNRGPEGDPGGAGQGPLPPAGPP